MEFKWLMIMIAVAMVAMSGTFAVNNYVNATKQSKCLASYAMSDRSAEEINAICK